MPDKSSGEVVQVNRTSILILKKESFLFCWLFPVPPFQCWDITEQLRTQTLTFFSTLGQGQGEEG